MFSVGVWSLLGGAAGVSVGDRVDVARELRQVIAESPCRARYWGVGVNTEGM